MASVSSGGGLVSSVLPGSLADEAGLAPGDLLIAINGHVLRDVIDYGYHASDDELVLQVERLGQHVCFEIPRDYERALGLEFAEPVFDRMRRCNNRCPFCFVGQLPKGMRPTLYVRDDDYRYSFLAGNFVTLTNLSDDDWQRMSQQRLSPLYVSIHATDLAVRRGMLGNPSAPDILAQLRRLGQAGIDVHGQIVVVPGVNDGEMLGRSVEELADLWPTVRSLAIVPVGLTRHHRGGLRLLRPDEAGEILDMADERVEGFRRRMGRSWLYPSDELYLLAGRPLPQAAFYDQEAQRENGVGLVRSLLDDWERARGLVDGSTAQVLRVTLVCGQLIAPFLRRMATELSALSGVEVRVVPVVNRFFGNSVTVSGLLTGQDVLAALAGVELGQGVFVPRAMFDASRRVTLDDVTLADLTQRLGVATTLVSTMSEVVSALGFGRLGSPANVPRGR